MYIENAFQDMLGTKFRSPKMEAKQRDKICICSVILWQLNRTFSNLQGFSIIYAKNLDAI